MYQVTLPDHSSPAKLRAASAFFAELASLQDAEQAEWERELAAAPSGLGAPTNVVFTTPGVTREEAADLRAGIAAHTQAEVYAQGAAVTELVHQGVEALNAVNAAIGATVIDAASIFGGAAAPAPLPEPSATAAPVPVPSSTIPEPSSVPAAAVPGPVITDAAAAIGLPSPSGPALDKEGLPWDHRIHAESKAQNQDGTWRKKRGVTDEEFARVKAEMKAMLAPTATSATVPGPSSTPTATPPAPAPTATALATSTGDSGYGAMMLWLNGPMTSQPQKITMSDLSATIANCAPIFGIEPPAGGFNISTIKLAPAPLIAMIRAELGTLAASRGWVDEVAG